MRTRTRNPAPSNEAAKALQRGRAMAHSWVAAMLPEPTGPRIPTTGKAQPPYQFCYPIGSSVVSEAFLDLPQFPLFMMAFSTNSPLMQAHWQIPGYPVLRLTYSCYPEY